MDTLEQTWSEYRSDVLVPSGCTSAATLANHRDTFYAGANAAMLIMLVAIKEGVGNSAATAAQIKALAEEIGRFIIDLEDKPE